MDALLTRVATSDQGTFGILEIDGGLEWYTLELPWRANQRSVSCIPVGEYECQWVVSRKYGHVYWVRTVTNRSGILIHAGNLAGDKSQGWLSHSKGCILLGRKQGRLGRQDAVLQSRYAMTEFHKITDGEDITLTIWQEYM